MRTGFHLGFRVYTSHSLASVPGLAQVEDDVSLATATLHTRRNCAGFGSTKLPILSDAPSREIPPTHPSQPIETEGHVQVPKAQGS